jgi:prepilin-type N-terminal cleavage/methylation domain-containing protein
MIKYIRGFTLIEFVCVMLIIGILSAYAAANLSSRSSDHYQYCREASALLREVQNININQGVTTDVYFISSVDGFGYCLSTECNDKSKWHNPVMLSTMSLTESKIKFNGLGQLSPMSSSNIPSIDGTKSIKINGVDSEFYCTVSITQEGSISWK